MLTGASACIHTFSKNYWVRGETRELGYDTRLARVLKLGNDIGQSGVNVNIGHFWMPCWEA